MESIAGLGTENPSQMGQAHRTITYPPVITGKPGKLIRGSAGVTAPDNASKATDIEDDPVRIGKSVAVGPLDGKSVIRPGDCLPALTAQDVFLLLGRWFFNLLFQDSGFALGARLVSRIAETIYTTCIEWKYSFAAYKRKQGIATTTFEVRNF